jgi:hypothetical protein
MKFKAFMTSSFICKMNWNNNFSSSSKDISRFILHKFMFQHTWDSMQKICASSWPTDKAKDINNTELLTNNPGNQVACHFPKTIPPKLLMFCSIYSTGERFTCWNLLTCVNPLRASLATFRCKTPKSAKRRGSSTKQ